MNPTSSSSHEYSAQIYNAFAANQQDKLKELSPEDRKIVLIALNNIRLAGQSTKAKPISLADTDRIVSRSKTPPSMQRVPSSFFSRVIKGIQNLFFGRISSSNLAHTLNEVKNHGVEDITKRLREKKEHLLKLRNKSAEIEELTKLLGVKSLGSKFNSVQAEYKKLVSQLVPEIVKLEEFEAALNPERSSGSGKNELKQPDQEPTFFDILKTIPKTYESTPILTFLDDKISKIGNSDTRLREMLTKIRELLAQSTQPRDVIRVLTENISLNKEKKIVEEWFSTLTTTSDPVNEYERKKNSYTTDEIYAGYREAIAAQFERGDSTWFLDRRTGLYTTFKQPLPHDVKELLEGEDSEENRSKINSLQLGLTKYQIWKRERNAAEFLGPRRDFENFTSASFFLDQVRDRNIDDLSTPAEALYIVDIDLTTIPEEIWNLTKLETLQLNNSRLMVLPDGIGKLASLKKLSLKDNKLRDLPDALWELQNLEELVLDNNQITTLPLKILELKKLKRISLLGNPLAPMPEAIKQFIMDRL